MTQRQRTASLVSTYVRPSDAPVQAINQRTRQVQGVFKQLGVVMEQDRQDRNEELAEKTRAESNNKARVLAAEYMPKIREQMERPETYDMSAEEFMKSDTFQLGVDQITNNIEAPDHRKEFLENYQKMMLEAFTDGKVKQEYKDREREASLAQQGAADTVGIQGQMDAYDDSIASGVERADAFTAGLATAILKGPEYLKAFAGARNWTPEEDIQIAKAIKSAEESSKQKKDAEFGYLKRLMGRSGLHNSKAALNAAYALRATKAHMMTDSELGGLQADIELLESKAGQFNAVEEHLAGGMSRQRLYNQYPDISNDDIDDVHNQMYRSAINADLLAGRERGVRVYDAEAQFLAQNPLSLPPTYVSEYKDFIGTLGTLNPHDAESLQLAEQQWKRHAQIMDELGPEAIEKIFQRDAGRVHVFNSKVRNRDFKTAVQLLQRWDENKAQNGGIGLRVDKKTSDYVRDEIFSELDIPNGQKTQIEFQVNSFINEARQLGFREKDDVYEHVRKGVEGLLVDGMPNSRPFTSFINEHYPEYELTIDEGVEYVRRQAGLGGLEIPEDADVYFDPTRPGRIVYFTDPETGAPYHTQGLDAHAVLGEYMLNNAKHIKTRKERNVDAVRKRGSAAERSRANLINRSHGNSGLF